MKDINNIKSLIKGAVDKIKSAVEKPDIPLADAYAQMDAELEEAEKAYGKSLFPEEDEQVSLDEHYLKVLGFKEKPSFDEIKAHYEALVKKFNPENFANDKVKQTKALKRIDLVNKAYAYFEKQYSDNTEEE